MLVATGLEELHDLFLTPAPQAGVVVLAQAGGVPAVEQGTGQERRAGFVQGLFVERQPPWRVATAAVAGALDDIGAPVPQCVLAGLGGIGRGRCKHTVPQGDGPTQVERPGNVAGDIRLVGRLHAFHEKRVQRLDVIVAELHIRRVGHGRIESSPTRCYAVAYGAVEVGQAIGADTMLAVGGDVGGVDRPQRCGHFQATSEWLLAGQAMAGHAVTHSRDVFAATDQGGVETRGLLLFKRRGRLAGDVPGQQAGGDHAGQHQPPCGSCESAVIHGHSLSVS